MRIWVIKCTKKMRDGSEGWSWDRHFKGRFRNESFEFGGDNWINSPTSKKDIREKVKTGGLVICYQSDQRGIVGLTQMDSGGERDKRSGEYNCFFLCPAQDSFSLKQPLRITDLRSTACDPACFRYKEQFFQLNLVSLMTFSKQL